MFKSDFWGKYMILQVYVKLTLSELETFFKIEQDSFFLKTFALIINYLLLFCYILSIL